MSTKKSTVKYTKRVKNISFSEKYIPKTLNDIIGNKSQITYIKNWLINYDKNKKLHTSNVKTKKKEPLKIDTDIDDSDEVDIVTDITADTDINVDTDIDVHEFENKNRPKNKKNVDGTHACMTIFGDHGVGKTCTITTILNSLEYNIQTIDFSKIGSNKNMMEYINKIIKCNNIYDQLNDNNNMRTAIIVDEMESAGSPIEKKFILTLLKKNEEYWYFPIIFISNGKHSKLITILRKNTNVVNFYQPARDNLLKLLIRLCEIEKIQIESKELGYKIVEHSQYDYRRLISILQYLYESYGNKIIQQNFEEYKKICKSKDVNINIYKAASNMITSYKSIDECLRLYEGEKATIPLMLQQNYITCLIKYNKNSDKSFKLADEIAKSIAFGDLVENYIYSDQNWDMQEVHGFLTCVNPAYKLYSERMNINNETFCRYELVYPMTFNRSSIKHINKKNIIKSDINLEITDFIYANKLVKHLIDDEKLEECANLFNDYGSKIKNIEAILKINKINETKTVLPTNIKKKLGQLLINNDKV